MGVSDNSLMHFQMQENNSRKKALRTLYGIIIVVGIAISWVGSTQFAKSTYTGSFDAPWFVVWFSTAWMSLSFPVILLCYGFAKGHEMRAGFIKAQSVFGVRGLCPRTLLTRCAPFVFLWCVCNYMYIRSLSILSATDVTALFSSTPAFVFGLSLLLLKNESFSWRRLVATVISIGGIVVIAYSNGFTGPSTAGVLLSVGAALTAATYKVTFKLFIGDGDLRQVSLFLTCLGLINLLCLWPIMEVMYFTRYEHINWHDVPWSFLCGSAALGLLFNFLINFGIAFTFPLFISLGTVLGIPLNAAVDAIWRDAPLTWLKGIGAVMIVVGFILMSLRTKQKEDSETQSSSPRMTSALYANDASDE